MNRTAIAAATIVAGLLTYAAPVAAQTKYYARSTLPGLTGSASTGTPAKPPACTTSSTYDYRTDSWTFLANAAGTSNHGSPQRVGEVPNVKGWPGAGEICEKAIKGTRRTGCVLLGQPATGLAIGVFITPEDRPTTYYVDENPDFALIATPITCSF